MQYEELGPISRSEFAEVIALDREEDLSLALIRLALHDPDPDYVQDVCLGYVTDSRVWVRRNSATSLGHIARLHRRLDLTRVVPALLSLAEDPEAASWAEAALDDINVFIKPIKH